VTRFIAASLRAGARHEQRQEGVIDELRVHCQLGLSSFRNFSKGHRRIVIGMNASKRRTRGGLREVEKAS
jgi:hypothetical protein